LKTRRKRVTWRAGVVEKDRPHCGDGEAVGLCRVTARAADGCNIDDDEGAGSRELSNSCGWQLLPRILGGMAVVNVGVGVDEVEVK
jgi:hypothetical protein